MISHNQNEHAGTPAPLDVLCEDPDLREKVAGRLRAIRESQNKSQRQVAKQLGLSRPHLSNIELGRSGTSWGYLQKMANLYKQDIDRVIADCRAPTEVIVNKKVAVALGAEAAELTRLEQFILHGFRLLRPAERHEVVQLIETKLGLHNHNQT